MSKPRTRIQTEEFNQYYQYGIYTPGRLLDLTGEIDEDRARDFIKGIRTLDYVSDKEIRVLINTPGGDVTQGLAIYDAIRECNSRVITHAVGPCWSMGAVILQAGDYRLMSQNATIMIHVGTAEFGEDHWQNIDNWHKELKRLGKITIFY